MGSQGDAILRDELREAIEANLKPASNGVCPSHDAIRQGLVVLLKCKRAEMRGSGVGGKVGVGSMVLGLLYAILKAHGVLP